MLAARLLGGCTGATTGVANALVADRLDEQTRAVGLNYISAAQALRYRSDFSDYHPETAGCSGLRERCSKLLFVVLVELLNMSPRRRCQWRRVAPHVSAAQGLGVILGPALGGLLSVHGLPCVCYAASAVAAVAALAVVARAAAWRNSGSQRSDPCPLLR